MTIDLIITETWTNEYCDEYHATWPTFSKLKRLVYQYYVNLFCLDDFNRDYWYNHIGTDDMTWEGMTTLMLSESMVRFLTLGVNDVSFSKKEVSQISSMFHRITSLPTDDKLLHNEFQKLRETFMKASKMNSMITVL